MAALDQLHAYIARTQTGNTGHLREAVAYDIDGFLKVDAATRRNLELVESSEGTRKGSLLAVVDPFSPR